MITGKSDPSDRSDDIAQLRQHLDMPELNYQDISMLVGVQQALQLSPSNGQRCRASSDEALYAAVTLRERVAP